MLIVDLIIILFSLKLDRFYCIGVMNWLRVIYYNLFYNQNIFLTIFADIKMSLIGLTDKNY